MHESPFISDVPAEAAVRTWMDTCVGAGCPMRLEAERVSLEDAVGRVTAEAVWATRSSPVGDSSAMDGIAVLAGDTAGASQTTPLELGPDAYEVVDTGDPIPDGFDAVVMREHVHYVTISAGEAGSSCACRKDGAAQRM